MEKLNNIPLPNLPMSRKLLYSLMIVVGLGLYLGTWLEVLTSIYGGEDGYELLGVGLGVLAGRDETTFRLFLFLHVLGIVFLLGASYALFRMTSIRRRAKKALALAAAVLAVLDMSGWFYAPHCSSTNLYVGTVSALASVPLLIIGIAPLFQMWVYRRWESPDGKTKRVVIVGGGFSGLYTALGLNRTLGYHQQLEITVIDRKNYFLFQPLLPSAAAGTIETRQVSYPFRRIFETANIRFRKVDVTSIDPSSKVVRGTVEENIDPLTGAAMRKETQFSYDYLVLAPGSTTQTFGTSGAEDHCFFMNELSDAMELRNHVIDCFERAAAMDDTEEQRELLRFVMIGAGPTGLETATEIYDLIEHVLIKRYPEINKSLPEVYLVQSGKNILPGWDSTVIQMASEQVAKTKIKLWLDSRVASVGPASVTMVDGRVLQTRTMVWCAGVKANELVKRSGLTLDKSGRVPVEPDLRVKEHPHVFVLGDVSLLNNPKTSRPLPPLGQVAFQQGSHAARNLVRLLSGRETRPFRYFDFGGLVSVGEHYAAVNLLGVKIDGFIGWVIWRSLYLGKLVGLSNKIRVLIDWTLDLLIERSISQIRAVNVPRSKNIERMVA